jgi:hypothetical protein
VPDECILELARSFSRAYFEAGRETEASQWQVIHARPGCLTLTRSLADGTQVVAEVVPDADHKPVLGPFTFDRPSDAAFRQAALEELMDGVANGSSIRGYERAIPLVCGLIPSAPVKRQRRQRHRPQWSPDRLAKLVEVVLARQEWGERQPADLRNVDGFNLGDRRVRELLLRDAAPLGLVEITQAGRRNRYQRPDHGRV